MAETAGRRERQSAQTRHEILDAARRLFASQGYSRTSVAAVAKEAGVSVQTIYDSVGGKAALVRGLNDWIDGEAGVGPIAARIPQATTGRELLDVAVSICRGINERCDDLIRVLDSAAAADPALAAVREEGLRRHRDGIARMCGRLEQLGELRPGMSAKAAAAVVAPLTDTPVARTFVHDHGWTWEAWHEWTLETLCRLVLHHDENVGGHA